MKISKKAKIGIISLAAISLITFLNLNKEKISTGYTITVQNSLSDIVITELYVNEDTTNLLEDNLLPNTITTLNLSQQSLNSIKAIDSSNGVYTPMVEQNSTEINITITDRFEFNNTIETNGEYWAGSGSEVLLTINKLHNKDIYTLTIKPYQSNREHTNNLLQAFILYPDYSINTRLNPGCYSVTATDSEGNIYIMEPVNIYKSSETTILEITDETQYFDLETSGEGSCSISLVNDLGDWVITEIYHKESSASEWSTNHINFQSLEPKRVYTLSLESGIYDIRVIDEINDSYTNFNISVDENNFTWFITMDNLDPFIP